MSSRILLADDSITIQKVVNLTFADEGIEVVAVSNGEMAERRLSEINPDLVLADIFMPGKNGYELCQFIKENPHFRHVPVILLVGAFEPFDQAEARRVRADAHLTKPFESRTLVETVRKLIEGSRPTATRFAPSAIPPEERASEPGAGSGEFPLLNVDLATMTGQSSTTEPKPTRELETPTPVKFDQEEAQPEAATPGQFSMDYSTLRRPAEPEVAARHYEQIHPLGGLETGGTEPPIQGQAHSLAPGGSDAGRPREIADDPLAVPSIFAQGPPDMVLDFDRVESQGSASPAGVLAFDVDLASPSTLVERSDLWPSAQESGPTRRVAQSPEVTRLEDVVETPAQQFGEFTTSDADSVTSPAEFSFSSVTRAETANKEEELVSPIGMMGDAGASGRAAEPLADRTPADKSVASEGSWDTVSEYKQPGTSIAAIENSTGRPDRPSNTDFSFSFIPTPPAEPAQPSSGDGPSPGAQIPGVPRAGGKDEASVTSQAGQADASSIKFAPTDAWPEEEARFAPVDLEGTARVVGPKGAQWRREGEESFGSAPGQPAAASGPSHADASEWETGFELAEVIAEESGFAIVEPGAEAPPAEQESPQLSEVANSLGLSAVSADRLAAAIRTPEVEEERPGRIRDEEQSPLTSSQPVRRDLESTAIDEIVRRVVAQITDSVVREIAWEVVPDCVERVVEKLARESVSKR